MVKVIKKHRKPPVLTASAIPCLKQLPTINITQGCALGCTYCYIRSYPGYPGPESIILFENTAAVLRQELKRKRQRPGRVYFSPSSDAFQYAPEVQAASLETMQVLLEQRIEVAFLTKGFIDEPFLDLFRYHPELVHAQVGITSLDRDLWRGFEPRTAPPHRRLQTVRRLRQIGANVTVRLDPLIPDVTDTPDNLEPLLAEIQRAGITFAAASYIFLRAGFGRALSDQLAKYGVNVKTWPQVTFTDGCGRGRMIPVEQRRRRFETLTRLGEIHGITIQPCRCKNPSLTHDTCHITGADSTPSEATGPDQDLPLFDGPRT
jgi:DNA repair photolyase